MKIYPAFLASLLLFACAHDLKVDDRLPAQEAAQTAPRRHRRSRATYGNTGSSDTSGAAAGSSEDSAGSTGVGVSLVDASSENLSDDADLVTDFTLDNRQPNWLNASLTTQTALNKTSDITGIYSNPDTPTVSNFLGLAQNSIDIEIYEINDPGVRAALRSALAKKVVVRLVKDPKPIGEGCDLFSPDGEVKMKRKASVQAKADCEDQRALVEEIKSAGGAFVPFNKPQLCGQEAASGQCFQHGKMAVIDHGLALISTGNFNNSNLCDLSYAIRPSACNRDFTYITRDPEVISALETIFSNDLAGVRYDLRPILTSGNLYKKLTVSPFSLKPLSEFIRTANVSIQLENQYIRPNSGLVDVLIENAQKGVKVEIQLTDECNFSKVSRTRLLQDQVMFKKMEAAGIKINMFAKQHRIHGLPGYLHAKVIVVDGRHAWVGSVNGSKSSLTQNREFGIFFHEPHRVRALANFLEQDFTNETNQTWDQSLSCGTGIEAANAAKGITEADLASGDVAAASPEE